MAATGGVRDTPMTGSVEATSPAIPWFHNLDACNGVRMRRSGAETFATGRNGIRARVIGKDITDSSHWESYLRSDGVPVSSEMGRKWTDLEDQNNRPACPIRLSPQLQ
jgi:hypothetical protein